MTHVAAAAPGGYAFWVQEAAPVTLTEADFVRAHRLHFLRYWRTVKPWLALSVFVIAWGLFTWLTWDDPLTGTSAVIMHGLTATLLALPLANYFVFVPRAARRAFRNHQAVHHQLNYSWSAAGLRVRGPQGDWQIAWRDYREWVEDDEAILVYQAPNVFQIVPKRALSESGAASLRQHLAAISRPDDGEPSTRP